MPAPGLGKVGFLRLRFSNNFAVGSLRRWVPQNCICTGCATKNGTASNPNGEKATKSYQNYEERRKWSEKSAKREPEERKGSKMEPKGTKMEPKANKMEPNACQTGAKRRPKCIQKSPWAPRSILGAKMVDRVRVVGSHFG